MKRLVTVFVFALTLLFLAACECMYVSDEQYNEISNYVLENIDSLPTEDGIEFFDYKITGLSIGGVYYGYYYSVDNEIAIPDYYCGDNLGEKYEADGGTYFGTPNSGTDWCFIKSITDNWYYYELHWA